MTYRTIHTTYGLRTMAQAEAAGVPINLTHMAVGDGNGVPASPRSFAAIRASVRMAASGFASLLRDLILCFLMAPRQWRFAWGAAA